MKDLCEHGLPLLLDVGNDGGLMLWDRGLTVSLYFDLDRSMGPKFGDLITIVHVDARERKKVCV